MSKHALYYSLYCEGFSCTEGFVRCMRCIELGTLKYETDIFGVTIYAHSRFAITRHNFDNPA